MIRVGLEDKKKSWSVIQRQVDNHLICCLDGCDRPLTIYEGPGSDSLCRLHQRNQREYNGTGRLDRPHTFHRKWVCDHCNKDVSEEVRKKYPEMETTDPEVFNRLCRNRIIGDHIIRKADGGDDSEENLQSLCLDCNSDKTILNEDFRKGSRQQV
jgi:5-methylcytosine-specific restriction endonuclease McrA